jgi:methyltransferase
VGWAALIVGLVALQRVAELLYARWNEARLRARGAIERGAGHYPLIVLLHVAWLTAIFIFAAKDAPPVWGWLGLYLALQGARFWAMTSLGPHWTTRIITLPGAPLIRRGPYRFLNHPNYAVVAAEIAVLPLAFREYRVALFFSALNLALLAWRLRIENAALAEREYGEADRNLQL